MRKANERETQYILCYTLKMKSNSLINTNPYLKNAAKRKKLVSRSVRTSCGVEGIEAKEKKVAHPITNRKNKKIYKNLKQTPQAAS